MRKIELSYTLTPPSSERSPHPALLRNPMMDVLHAVRSSGSISGAARELGLSYRHVWGQLKDWEAGLGQQLIFWERGQAARLTPFGERLLMAERLAQARLGPQMESLRAELERAFSMVFDEGRHGSPGGVLTLYASHDHALTELQRYADKATENRHPAPPLHMDIRFCGSVDAIRALNEGRCELAGFHTQPFAAAGSLSARAYRPLLKPGLHKIIGFARRSQGLMVAPDNPLRLREVGDVARLQARFVNRAIGTGTRLLLDELLAQAGLLPQDIVGYTHVESSHAAVAHAVASGTADVGLGTEYAARAQGLGFVPLTQERYLLVCLKSALEQPAVQQLLQRLRSRTWHDHLNSLPGYATDHCGEVAAMKRLLPWWD
ncbi:substrate-binding domain-containing protein [Hydrogenophaga laconesensis]|uniref:Molybdate transport repressor ModE-like protein n=1 Tax=Hydrogenophaga laconesensis TaxID=1805971 RepID=A0ABU1VEH8_9BURK|nr:substrate-binding domain-containing protein [Hydrogenophaga laconesensis]MDR7095745.1 molybdate transport repressor ModE-like protein [Hydrogenophaga laconesensis]